MHRAAQKRPSARAVTSAVMELQLAVLCDYTTVSQEGKLSILGIFERIYARQFPARHRKMELAMQIRCSRADIGHERDVQVHLVDQDGHVIVQSQGNIGIPADVQHPPTINIVQIFEDVEFPAPGPYSFNIYLSGRQVAALSLDLVQIQDDRPGPDQE